MNYYMEEEAQQTLAGGTPPSSQQQRRQQQQQQRQNKSVHGGSFLAAEEEHGGQYRKNIGGSYGTVENSEEGDTKSLLVRDSPIPDDFNNKNNNNNYDDDDDDDSNNTTTRKARRISFSTINGDRMPTLGSCFTEISRKTIRTALLDAELWRAIFSEFMGTFILIFVGCGVEVTSRHTMTSNPHSEGRFISGVLCWGFIIVGLIYSFGDISGAIFNPAITIAFTLARRLHPLKCIAFIVAQLVGATAASLVILGILPTALEWDIGATKLGEGISPWRGALIEAMVTFILVWVVFSTGIDRNRGTTKVANIIGPIPVGLTVMSMILLAATSTGASMNPARSFGPSLVASFWDYHWVYWLGPILGASISSIAYQMIFMSKRSMPPLSLSLSQQQQQQLPNSGSKQ